MNDLFKILNIVTLAGLVALGILCLGKKEKYGYVDNIKLIANYKGMEAAKAQFQQKTQQWQANIDTLTVDINKAIVQYNKDSISMSRKERAEAKKNIVYLQQQLVSYKGSIQQLMQQEDEKITKQLLTELNILVEEYAKKHGYTIIWGATSVGNIVYARDAKNLTDEILEELNSK